MKFGTMIMRKAESFKVGDTVVFSNPKFNYTIEDVYTSVQGKVCHRFNDDTGLACYFPEEILYAPE